MAKDLQTQNEQSNLLKRIQALEDSHRLHNHKGYDLTSKLINFEANNMRIINEAVLGDGKEHSGSLEFKIAPGKGDVQAFAGIAAGDFANTGAVNGFIFGVDDSDGDKVKFYWGNATKNIAFDGSTLTISGTPVTANIAQFAGDGSDGDVTISVNTTLTSDKYYNNLTVNDAVRLITDGYKVYVKDTLTMGGSTAFISNNGGNAGNGGNASSETGGSAGTAGAAAGGGTTGISLSAGLVGQAGGTGDTNEGQVGGNGGNAANITGLSSVDAVNGLAGGNGGSVGATAGGSGGNAGTGGTGTLASRTLHTISEASLFINFSTPTSPALYNVMPGPGGSGGGGSGAGDGVNQGGGGGGSGGSGAPGGVTFVFATTIAGTGFIESNGGNGGNGGNAANGVGGGGPGGGGGGSGGSSGNGGVVFAAYISKAVGVTLRATAGTAGTGGTKGTGGNNDAVNGSAGNTGNAGTIIEFDLSE